MLKKQTFKTFILILSQLQPIYNPKPFVHKLPATSAPINISLGPLESRSLKVIF